MMALGSITHRRDSDMVRRRRVVLRRASVVAGDLALRWGLLVILVVLWEIFTRRSQSLFFPPPSEIVQAVWTQWFSAGAPLFLTESVFSDIVPSMRNMFQGWLLAAFVGITLGIVVGRSRWAADLAMPIVNFLRSTPGPALIPVFLILLGTGTTMRVSLIAFSSVWPVLLNTIDGVQTVDRVKLDTARAFSLPRGAVLRRVVLPAAMPKILAGLRVATAVALVLMVISELIAATHGLGHFLAESVRFFRMTQMWAAIVLLGAIGYFLNLAFLQFERRKLRWHAAERRR